MAQFIKELGTLGPVSNNVFEVVMLGNENGQLINDTLRLPVDIGTSANITISGNVSIPGEVNVVSTREDPVITQSHIFSADDNEISNTNPFAVNVFNRPESSNVVVTNTIDVNYPATQNVVIQVNEQPVSNTNRLPTETNFESMRLDAFGRLRISEPVTLFDSTNLLNENGKFSSNTVGNANTEYLINESTINLNIQTTSGDQVIEESNRVFTYQPGKSLLVYNSFVLNDAKTNLRQRTGLFSTENGIFLEQDDSTVYLVKRSFTTGSAVDTRVSQSNWNYDKLDGTGVSGVTLDFTKVQILFIDIEWLGAGTVRCGFIVDGQFLLAHRFNHSNIIDSVYMSTPNLPIRHEITNTGATSSNSTFKKICSTVMSEGGYQRKSRLNVARRTSATTVGTSFEPLVTIRLASDSLDSIILPHMYRVLATSAGDDFEIALIRNASLTGASFDTSTFDHVDFDITATALTGGTIEEVSYATSGFFGDTSPGNVVEDYNFELQLGRTVDGVSDTLTLAARTLSDTGTIIGSLSFYDLT